MGFTWHYEGRAWVFGDGIGVDGDLMPLRFALMRETRPDVLAQHVFEQLDPAFARNAEPGDIIVAGRQFAQGNPHIQGLIGIKGLSLGLVAESIQSGSLRNTVNAGLPCLPRCSGVRTHISQGDRLRVDFESGSVANLSTGWSHRYAPLAPELRQIVAAGGWGPSFQTRLDGETAGRRPAPPQG